MNGEARPDQDHGQQGSAYSADTGTFQKSISIRPGQTDAIVVEMPQWDRIERRVKALEDLWAIEWLAAGSSFALSTGIGCIIAALTIPDGKGSGIGPAVRPGLLIGAAASLLLAAVCLGLHIRVKKDRSAEGADIIDEMETYEKSFALKRAGETKPAPVEGTGSTQTAKAPIG